VRASDFAGNRAEDLRCANYLPAWVRRSLGSPTVESVPVAFRGFRLDRSRGNGLSLLAAKAPQAGELDGQAFADQTFAVYEQVLEQLREEGLHPWRFWNYIPDVHRSAQRFRRRYEAFNAGRHEAFRRAYGEAMEWPLAPASAVGNRDHREFRVYALASDCPGMATENPRQIPAYRYSREHGEFPPCFSRGLLLPPSAPVLGGSFLISGTASIVGETSRHHGDLARQIDEMLGNLAALAHQVVRRQENAPLASERGIARSRALERCEEVRLYVVRPDDVPAAVGRVRAALPQVQRTELIRADLCRPELLVEIEGILSAG
jgi:chorismate lyase / 3-hydroxybenzoate synthase